MIVFPDIAAFLYIPLFVLALFAAFFIPGDFFVRRLNLSAVPRVTLATILGICLWAFQGLIFGYLHARFLSYFYIFIMAFLWFRSYRIFPKIKFRWDWLAVVIVFFGGIIQMSAVWLIGVRQGNDLLFCCRSVPDAIYHLSLTNELVNRFPPFEPGSTGIVVQNYHYLANLVMADLVRVFHIPLIPNVYQYTPVLLIILLGMTALSFCEIIGAPKGYKYLLLFFIFFSGDINYLLTLITTGKLDFAVTSFDSAALLMTGPPRAFSMVIFFGLLSFIVLWVKKKTELLGLILALLSASLVGFKIYTAAAVFVGLAFLTFYYRKLWPLLLAIAVALLIYLPVNAGAGGLVYAHFWRLEDFIVKPQFQLSILELARQTYQAAGNWPRVLSFELLFFILFVVFNFGTNILSFAPLAKVRKLFPLGIFGYFYSGQIALLVLGIFFFQKIGGANTVQFLISLETFSAILAAAVVWIIFASIPRWFGVVFLTVIIILTGTRVVRVFLENINYQERELIVVPKEELDALSYLRNNTPKDSIVAISPGLASQIVSLRVPLLSDRSAFLAGISDHGVEGLGARIAENREIFRGGKIEGVDYLYVPKNEKFVTGLNIAFENDVVTIYLSR